ncbi:hypothetical protein V866_007677 [Kwoniella sp. B9012]
MTTTRSRKPTLLFITSPEAGQANCNFAVISSLKAKHGDAVDIHLASYINLEKRIANQSGSEDEFVSFHRIKGISLTDGLMRRFSNNEPKMFGYARTPSGLYGSILSAIRTTRIVQPDTPEEYVETARDVERIIQDVNPDYILVDPLLSSARDAIRKSGKKAILLTPNTAKEAALSEQGLGVFAIPAVCTAYKYPIPWYLLPANTFITLFFAIWLFLIDGKHKKLNKARNQAGYEGVLPLFDRDSISETSVICMSTVGAELPLIIPDWVKCCGPIIQKSKKLAEVDPKSYEWCNLRPTVLVSLGTNLKYSEKDANEMLRSLRVLLGIRKDIQVLWKLKKLGEYDLPEVVGDEDPDRLRIVDWLEADPFSILQSGNVVCFVSHGGSNSYHEALYAGIPQVILPAWADCYDFTARLRYLGIGAWGNPKACPGCSEPELTKALLQVIGRTPEDVAAKTMRERARELGRLVTDNYTREGRDVAADHIWAEIERARSET